MKISIVDYGLGNLFSLANAIGLFENDLLVTDDLNRLRESDVLVLPGVGAFGDGMNRLQSLDIDHVLVDHASKDKPILGVCLGMQLLLESSHEFGYHKGLGIIEGSVKHFREFSGFDNMSKVPHVGWNKIQSMSSSAGLKTINHQDMYFAHSLCALTTNPQATIATACYGNIRFAAAIQEGSILGCQFHPEKSAASGLSFLQQFMECSKAKL